MSKLIAPRLCLECRDAFTPRKPEQKYCPKPSRCAYQAASRLRKGQPPMAAIAKRRQMRGQAAAALVAERFGTLSARELEIYGIGHRAGYDEGYQAAYAPMRVKAS